MKNKKAIECSAMEGAIIELQERKRNNNVYDKETASLCLLIIEHHPNVIEKCRAAIILGNVIDKNEAKKVQEFLKKHSNIDNRLRQILEANIMRMAGF